jgi:hypothetical protein
LLYYKHNRPIKRDDRNENNHQAMLPSCSAARYAAGVVWGDPLDHPHPIRRHPAAWSILFQAVTMDGGRSFPHFGVERRATSNFILLSLTPSNWEVISQSPRFAFS